MGVLGLQKSTVLKMQLPMASYLKMSPCSPLGVFQTRFPLDIYGPNMDPSQSEEPTSPDQNNQENQDFSTNFNHQSPPRTHEAEFDGDEVPKGRSIAHSIYNNKLAYFIRIDIETGGEYVGIVQLSAQLCIVKQTANGSSTVKDKAESITIAPDVFDSYANPNKPPGLWDKRAIAVHGIAPNQIFQHSNPYSK